MRLETEGTRLFNFEYASRSHQVCVRRPGAAERSSRRRRSKRDGGGSVENSSPPENHNIVGQHHQV